MKIILRIILTPNIWWRVYHKHTGWDALLNEILDSPVSVVRMSRYTHEINGVTVWTGNWPYGYGQPYDRLWKESVLPSRRTALRLKMTIEKLGADKSTTAIKALRARHDKYLAGGNVSPLQVDRP